MKKILMLCVVLLASASTFASVNTVQLDGKALHASDNSTNWSLKRNGDSYNIQNVSGKVMRVAVFVDKVVQGTVNTLSDSVYVSCANGVFNLVKGGAGIICDISYPGNSSFLISPFTNGATGRYTIIS